jgi:hypothetical protein
MTKRNFEQARSCQRGRDAACDDSDAALLRSTGSHIERGKLRLVICPGCGRERYVEIAPTETRKRARCTACGASVDL